MGCCGLHRRPQDRKTNGGPFALEPTISLGDWEKSRVSVWSSLRWTCSLVARCFRTNGLLVAGHERQRTVCPAGKRDDYQGLWLFRWCYSCDSKRVLNPDISSIETPLEEIQGSTNRDEPFSFALYVTWMREKRQWEAVELSWTQSKLQCKKKTNSQADIWCLS